MEVTSTASEAVDLSYLDEGSRKALANRLARLTGHLNAIRDMVLEKRCADEILLQVSAVKAALSRFAATLVEHELKACVDTCMVGDADGRLQRVTKALGALLKQT